MCINTYAPVQAQEGVNEHSNVMEPTVFNLIVVYYSKLLRPHHCLEFTKFSLQFNRRHKRLQDGDLCFPELLLMPEPPELRDYRSRYSSVIWTLISGLRIQNRLDSNLYAQCALSTVRFRAYLFLLDLITFPLSVLLKLLLFLD